MNKLFGTDGIRGIANAGNMTADIAMKLGAAIGTIFKRDDRLHKVVIGKDTRLSGYLLEPALTAGFISVGMDVRLVGPMPTPSVAMLTKSLRADVGIVISASHNTFQYNGIKVFTAQGLKLDPSLEQEAERLIRSYPNNISFATPNKLGRARRLDDAPGRYIEFAKNTFPKGLSLNGLKLVIDSANGSAYHLVKNVFWELGAEVVQIGDKPDGFNINDGCGSMHPELAARTVLETGADLGIVLDGDADRVFLIDETGAIINGDRILSTIALHMKNNGTLIRNTVVATHLSNLGFETYLNDQGIALIRTDVGDKYVAKAMYDGGYNLGGEQSGHVILSNFCLSGDGIIAALQVLAAWLEPPAHADYHIAQNVHRNGNLLCSTGHGKLSKFCHQYDEMPQRSFNVTLQPDQSISKKTLADLTERYQRRLGTSGRVLIRKSGTEPLVRVMIEAEDAKMIEKLGKEVMKQISESLGQATD